MRYNSIEMLLSTMGCRFEFEYDYFSPRFMNVAMQRNQLINNSSSRL